MPLTREPRTAEARGHQMRVAAVLASVAQKYGGQHREVFSPDFVEFHKPGDRWFCTICFAPMACTADGQLVASNNGVERDGETQRLTVHCSDKNCRKRQCKAINLSFKNSASMSEAVVSRIVALMRETSAQMEKSLGDVLCPSRGKGGKSSKSSKGSKSGKNGKSGKSGKTTKCPKASKSTSSSKVPKVELPAQKQQVVPAGSQKTGKGQPTPVTQMGMQVVKMPSPAIREAAEMLLDVSDRIPFGGVGCSSIKLWNTFNRKTRMCRTVNEIMQQVTWLVGQFKPNIFYPKWLASAQSEWLVECSKVEDVKHCKLLIQRLDCEALNWEAVNKLWQSEDRAMDIEGHGVGATRSGLTMVSRRSGALAQHAGVQERWSSNGPVQLEGWKYPKKITFVMGVQTGLSLKSAHLPSSGAEMEVGMKKEWATADESAAEEDDTSTGFEEPPSPWADCKEEEGDGHCGSGVKHDRGVLDSGYKFSAQDFGSPALPPATARKSPLVSPFARPHRMDGAMVDLDESAMGGDEELPSDSDFEDKAAEFDGQELSTMSTEHAYNEPGSWRCADLNADLTITDLGPADLVMGSC